MYVNGSLIKNINENSLINFLKSKGCIKGEGESGKDTTLWIGELLDNKRITSTELNEFLFQELFYGRSNMINIFEIVSCKKMRDEQVWNERLSESYNINSTNFNEIISTVVHQDTPIKIVAMNTLVDEEGKVICVDIILARYIQINLNGRQSSSCCFIPIKFDLDNKLLIIKIRNQYGIPEKEHRPKATLDKIFEDFKLVMDFETITHDYKHQKVLYNMSKGLLEELYNIVPNYNSLTEMDEYIEGFINNVIDNMDIINVEDDAQGKKIINKGVIDLKDEINKVLQQLVVADYFFNEDIDLFSKNNVSAVITSIKFNDKEKNTARLAGEDNAKVIVCSRTFMSMRKSIEAVENVFALSIAHKRKSDSIEVKFDASEKDRLSILILNQKNYTEEDYNKIWRMYKKYEKKSFNTIERYRKEYVG
ncbi:hypothetical protein SAMN05444401_3014 [Clostridium amylolyticum]|uniref:Uncharacterized protein n=1 Tax=Clostridium amylolyticum TaxID=1121298 RepID=A0A1M6JAA9_9CLOT|nr:hypothetical protein [Clostridium amylolyticum]SHJ43637.1 hypothetical protein SAMN05444401_3014 [Clostridium amylolyticum]